MKHIRISSSTKPASCDTITVIRPLTKLHPQNSCNADSKLGYFVNKIGLLSLGEICVCVELPEWQKGIRDDINVEILIRLYLCYTAIVLLIELT